MNKEKENAVSLGLAFIVVFVMGYIIAPDAKIETVEVFKNETEWRQLVETDNLGFALAADGMRACGLTLQAASEFDVDGMAEHSSELNRLTNEVLEVSAQRRELLTKLGY